MISKAEGQRKLSLILSDKRKKDPVGLLRAQRNGTLNEYLREDLAKHGLAVAGVTPPPAERAPTASTDLNQAASGASRGATNTSSYKVPTDGKLPRTFPGSSTSSAPTVSSPAAALAGSRSAHGSSVSASPPQPEASSRSTAPSRPTPGKLSASRFNQFGRGSEAGSALGEGTKEGTGSSTSTRSSSSPPSRRRWTVGPSSSPTLTEKSAVVKGVEAESVTGLGGKSIIPSRTKQEGEEEQQAATPVVEAEPGTDIASVGNIAERFGGVKLRSSGGGCSKFGVAKAKVAGGVALVDSDSSSGNSSARGGVVCGAHGGEKLFSSGGGGSGRIAELARRFEKDKSGN